MDAQDHYRQQSIETASPAQLVSMLYHGAIAATVRAEAHLAAGSTEGANRELQKAQDIVNELRLTLDFERGGEIARNLSSLYGFCLDRLIDANITKDAAPLPAVRSTLGELAGAWDEMAAAQVVPVAPTPVGAVG